MTGDRWLTSKGTFRFMFAPRRVKFIPHGHDVASPLNGDVTKALRQLLLPIFLSQAPRGKRGIIRSWLPGGIFISSKVNDAPESSVRCSAPSLIMVSRVASRFARSSRDCFTSEGNGWISGTRTRRDAARWKRAPRAVKDAVSPDDV